MSQFQVITGGRVAEFVEENIIHELRLKLRFGEFFERARLQNGYTAEDLDERLGMLRGTYRSWEGGFSLPAAKMLSRILCHFDISTNIEFQEFFNDLQREARAFRDECSQIG